MIINQTNIKGLTTSEIKQRIDTDQVNRAVGNQSKTNIQIICENTFTYFNLIFFVLAVLLILINAYKNLTFLPVIILNTIIGIVQEIRAKQILSKLSILNTVDIITVRNDQKVMVPMEKLVKDDIVLLKTGDQIPADAQVITGEVRVNESLLTGEADEITKSSGNNLMSGSFVVSGSACARLIKVGKDSYISKLMIEAKTMNMTEQSKMVRSINRLIKWVGIIIIPMGLILFSQSYFVNHASLEQSVVSMEAALIGMIPEGLYLLTTIALALSATRLAKKDVMLHDMKSVETLARVNVLCVDKTGTITEPKMTVKKFILSKKANINKKELEQKIANFVLNMSNDNTTMNAISSFFKGGTQKASDVVPFTSVNKFSAVVFDKITTIIGAPEIILKDQFKDCKKEFKDYVTAGSRVLVVADYQGVLSNDNVNLVQKIIPLGYIILSNPIRKEAKNIFAYFDRQKVKIKVISGDNPIAVANIAAQAGITGAKNYIDARTIKNGQYEKVVKEYNVFGRVKPDQKQKLITALQSQGHTVAMIGDGVNDILAMKKADCSIAMASGNNAAVQAAQVVLLDSNFAKMPEIVNEGRRVVNNIQRSASLFLVKNIFSFLMAIFSLIMTINYPLQPSQITLISACTIGLPSFLLALESNHKQIRGNFIFNVLTKAIPGGITDMLAVSILVIASPYITLGNSQVGTTATLLLILVGCLVMYHISAPLNKFRLEVMIVSIMTVLGAIIFLHNLFALTVLYPRFIFILVILFFAATTTFRWLSKILDGIAEVLVIFDRKGKKMTLADVKNSYEYGRDNKN